MATNAITDYKDALVGGHATVADKLNAASVDKMVARYEESYAKIYAEITKARGGLDYATYARQTQLLKQIGGELAKFQADAADILKKDLERIAKVTSGMAIKDMDTLGVGTTKADEWHKEYNVKYVEQIFKDSFRHVAAQTTKMDAGIKTQLRKDTSSIMQRASVEGWTRKQATKELMGEVMKKTPTFRFVDKAGRHWDSKQYFSMLTQTLMHTAQREVYVNTLTNEGHDLVIVSRHAAKDGCSGWEGKVLSLTGATKGYPTLASAISTRQIFHPRCKHSLFAYDPVMDEAAGMTDAAVEEMAKDTMAQLALDDAHAADKVKLSDLAVKLAGGHVATQEEADFIKIAQKLYPEEYKAAVTVSLSGFYNVDLSALAVAKPVVAKGSKVAEPAKAYPEGMFDIKNFEKVGAQKGSNEGGVYKSKLTGEKFYIKVPQTETHVKNELLAANLYRLAGEQAPELTAMKWKDGRTAIASKWVDGVQTYMDMDTATSKQFKTAAHTGFAVDAWISNWDVVGLNFDNIGMRNGKVFRIDVGGALAFRAQGGVKWDMSGNTDPQTYVKVTEIATLRDKLTNDQSAKIFGAMSDAELLKSMKRVAALKNQDIAFAISEAGFKGEEHYYYQKLLESRRDDVKRQMKELEAVVKQKVAMVKAEKLISVGIAAAPPPTTLEEAKEFWALQEPSRDDLRAIREHNHYLHNHNAKGVRIAQVEIPSLRKEEAVALNMYTGNHYHMVNDYLRKHGLNGSANKPWLAGWTRTINSAIKKMTEGGQGFKGESYRGIKLEGGDLTAFLDKWKPGNVGVAESFWSTTSDKARWWPGPIQIVIKGRGGGADIDSYSQHDGESEVLYGMGTRFKVTKVDKEKWGSKRGAWRYTIYMEEV